MKEHIITYYKQHRAIPSPLFWYIKLNPYSLRHLEHKDKKHKRPKKEVDIRYKCFLLIDKIISKSHLFQEYKKVVKVTKVKKYDTEVTKYSHIEYYWFVWVIYTDSWILTRIKVVIRKIGWQKSYEFISVIPAWNTRWYNKLYFDSRL